MIRLIIASVILFLIQVGIFCAISPALLEKFIGTDIKYLTLTEKQRRVIYNIQRQKEVNRNLKSAIYILGGSTAREFFPKDNKMKQLMKREFINMAAANQTITDSFRLADNINTPDAIVVYCIYPMKFMRFKSTELAGSKYLMGVNMKYPVPSQRLDDLLAEVKPNSIATSLLPEFNVFIYLMKNYILEKNRTFRYKMRYASTNLLDRMFINPDLPPQHFYDITPYNHNRLILDLLKVKKEIGDSIDKKLEMNFYFLGQIIDLSKSKGQQLKLIELPYSSTVNKMFKKELNVYRRYRDNFLSDYPEIDFYQLPYLSYAKEKDIFYDHGHLLTRGRRFFFPFVERCFSREISHADQS